MTTIQTETKTCPDWCASHIQEDDGTLLTHRGELGFEDANGNQVGVTVLNEIIPSLNPVAETWVDLHAVDCDLLPADARRAAAALLTAADLAEGREPLPWARLSEWFQATTQEAGR
jgi:hypothetical protein